MTDPKQATRDLAARYAAAGDPNGWFDEFYARADGDIHRVYWADLAPNPHLVAWLESHAPVGGRRAAVVGCGLGDDAEVLARHGYHVTAFDISAAAVGMCRERYPDSSVRYVEGDLFDPPADWRQGFDLVFECNTIQILVDEARERSLPAIADLVAPGGVVLVSCRGREAGEKEDAFPVPLDRREIGRFVTEAGLVERSFLAHDDTQDPPVPHFFAVYRREPVTTTGAAPARRRIA
ncbi:methyltransferase domain-containing protein [bacterium]|nr:methyltransferase domain-containing protein [bacterium]